MMPFIVCRLGFGLNMGAGLGIRGKGLGGYTMLADGSGGQAMGCY